MSSIEVVPAIIPKSLLDIHEHVGRVKDLVHKVQIDVMDGHFAPTKSWPFTSSEDREKLQEMSQGQELLFHGLDFEVDMMIDNPQYFMDDWINIGASSLVIHNDSTDSLDFIIESARTRGVSVGVAFKPSYGPRQIEERISNISFIQIMGSDRIGYNGVALDERVYDIASELRLKYPHVTIAVDIGVNKETAPKLIEAGVDKLISGSAIFESENISEAINFFKNIQ